MCGYQCDKAMTKNDTREVIWYHFTAVKLYHITSRVSFLVMALSHWYPHIICNKWSYAMVFLWHITNKMNGKNLCITCQGKWTNFDTSYNLGQNKREQLCPFPSKATMRTILASFKWGEGWSRCSTICPRLSLGFQHDKTKGANN